MKRVYLFIAFLWLGIMDASAQSNKFDLNDDGEVNVSDVTLLITYILGQDNGNSSGSNVSANLIDLGLPSGTKWASCNVGATKPEEYGGYYAWGETEEKDVYNYSTYIHCDGSEDTCHDLGFDISGTEYDVAHVKWGGDWVMPTEGDIQELLDNCTSEWTTLNDVNGMKFTSKVNGNSIFIPAAGDRWNNGLSGAGSLGYYWSSTQDPSSLYLAYGLFLRSANAYWGNHRLFFGYSVRPVVKPKVQEVPAEPIDLGLPSGTKWASCNVGATKPEEYGGYYAWGETEEKDFYDESTYKYYRNGSYVSLGSDISGTEYDVAHVKWGGDWIMPTKGDIKELLGNCTSEWTTLNGVNGRKFTSKVNGNSIFLPAAGDRRGGDLVSVEQLGVYWSSTHESSYTDDSGNILGFYSNDVYCDYFYGRNRGSSVRPVIRN